VSNRPVIGECVSKREKLGDASQRFQIPREMPSNNWRPETHGDKFAKPRPPATPSFVLIATDSFLQKSWARSRGPQPVLDNSVTSLGAGASYEAGLVRGPWVLFFFATGLSMGFAPLRLLV
jgi:hypothetical protein